ncbi:hypothetical protein ABZU75_20085 [Streptosporangium sp. NPDC005286]|uniref:alpha/beta hydrolase family protein n=1 Tax=Streptosporangium sp. NPDC005286 TaxID=3154463 RepID=UPI00339FD023
MTVSDAQATVHPGLLARMTGGEVNAFLGQAGFPSIENAKGVDVYSVTYRTVDVKGRPTTATGSLVLPQTPAHELPVVSYSHGTMADRREAPSVTSTGEGRYLPVYFATHGFAAAAADYLGLGEGPGAHPYMHTATEAGASVDLLKAARRLAWQQQVTLDKRIMVTGFSQGGQGAVAGCGQSSMARSQRIRAGTFIALGAVLGMSSRAMSALPRPRRTWKSSRAARMLLTWRTERLGPLPNVTPDKSTSRS